MNDLKGFTPAEVMDAIDERNPRSGLNIRDVSNWFQNQPCVDLMEQNRYTTVR